MEDILIACVDGLTGFPEAINSIYPQTEVQLCVIHQIRNSIKYVASKHHKAFMADLKPVYRAVTKKRQRKRRWMSRRRNGDSSIRWCSSRGVASVDNLSGYFRYPANIRKVIYTNPMQ